MKTVQQVKLSTLSKWFFSAGIVCSLAACGGSDSPAVVEKAKVASSNITAAVTASTVGALVAPVGGSVPVVVFSNGFSGVNPNAANAPVVLTGSTSVSFTGAGNTPPFKIENGGKVATGATTFGSCIFTITESTFQTGHPLAKGAVFKVDPCEVTAVTGGQTVGGTGSTAMNLKFGSTVSSNFSQPVSIANDGSISVGGVTLGKVTVVAATGS